MAGFRDWRGKEGGDSVCENDGGEHQWKSKCRWEIKRLKRGSIGYECLSEKEYTGTIGLRRSNGFELVLFALSTIILPPIVEETFFRKGLIALENNTIMTITLVFSMFLYAAEHALSLWGIFLTMIWAFPLSISFIKTKNVYIPMTAHFIINLIGNGTEVLFTIVAMLQ